MTERPELPSTLRRLTIRALETISIRVPNRPQLRDGLLQLSEQPGLGWELDWEYVDRYRVRDEVGL